MSVLDILTDESKQQMLGYKPEEVAGKKIINYVSESKKEEVKRKIKDRIESGKILGGKKECLNYRDHFDLMIDELDRANSIISQYLSFAKNKPVKKLAHNLNSIVENIYPLLQADAIKSGKSIELYLSLYLC